MWIEKISVKGFAGLKDLVVSFSKGLNLVYGPNESGKSTVQMFIKAMFFGIRGGRAGRDGIPAPLKKYRPWSGNEYSGTMEYVLDSGEKFRVERDFNDGSVRVYDAFLSDITDDFDIGRDKSLLIAEKHLGLNEACFESTAFIRQMGVVCSKDSAAELASRLTNAAQTGFEDVSLKSALEVLRKTLLDEVGTEKTTTRPLNKIKARLEELAALRDDLVNKRKNYGDIEEKLRAAKKNRVFYETALEMMEETEKLLGAEEKIQKAEEKKKSLLEIAGEASDIRARVELLEKRISEYEKQEEELRRFSRFEEKDIENAARGFERYNILKREQSDTEALISDKKAALDMLYAEREKLKALDAVGEDFYKKLPLLYRGINDRATPESAGLKADDRSFAANRRKTMIFAVASLLSAIGAVAVSAGSYSAAGVLPPALGTAAALVLAAAAVLCAAGALTASRAHKTREKAEGSKEDEETRKLREELEQLMSLAGAADLEELLLMKRDYDGISEKVAAYERDIEELLARLEETRQAVAALKEDMVERLSAAGVIPADFETVEEGHVGELAEGIRAYSALGPKLEYARAERENLEKRLELLGRRVAEICGAADIDTNNLESEAIKHAEKFSEEVETARGQAGVYRSRAEELVKKCREADDSGILTAKLPGVFPAKLPDRDTLKEKIRETAERLEQTRLEIKECETLLLNAPQEEEIQLVEEEIRELGEKRQELEELANSLTIAAEVLKEAGAELQRDFTPYLNSRMSEIAAHMTGNRYKNVSADREMQLKAVSPESEAIVPAMLLSGGTTDQLYLAFRIALAEFFSKNSESLPLIMDEVFSQFDDERTIKTMEFLKTLSENRQLILFTCKARELELARQIWGDDVNIVQL